MRRKTYAYNGITFGMLAGIAAAVGTDSLVIGIIVLTVVSIISFLIIRALENAMYKGADKVSEAITRKNDQRTVDKMKQAQQLQPSQQQSLQDMYAQQNQAMQSSQSREPWICPRCGNINNSNHHCTNCGLDKPAVL